jgi:Na+/H+-dicarboxylate symporter
MDYALTALTIVLVSVGSAGIPGGTFYLLPVLFNQLDIPLAAWALIYAVDRFIDMQRTVINVTGDAAVSMMVDASEGKLDRKVYNEPNKFD